MFDYKMSQCKTKPTIRLVWWAQTQISLHICGVHGWKSQKSHIMTIYIIAIYTQYMFKYLRNKTLTFLYQVTGFWRRFTAAKFTIRNFYNPFSQKCKPNNFLKSSSILTPMSLNSAFKHVILLHSDNYQERPNIQNKENFKLLKK